MSYLQLKNYFLLHFWYKYEEKKWANAVILKSGVTYEIGEVIPEKDIESYFVWVPKYKYKLLLSLSRLETVSLLLLL